MKILIAGSHGMIGSAVTPYLIECGHDVTRLVRQEPGVGEVWWGPDAGQIHPAGLEGFDGVVHLASGKWPMRWTAGAKKKMLANHLGTNRLLALSLAGCNRKPQVLICASGMGYYRSSGDEVLTEDCPPEQAGLPAFNVRARRQRMWPARRVSAWCTCASRWCWAGSDWRSPASEPGTGSNG